MGLVTLVLDDREAEGDPLLPMPPKRVASSEGLEGLTLYRILCALSLG